ncbi:ABC transporter permease [Nocardia sp. NPDC058176]|uniref:ABC transporter permease n=1 Tax=Nocardia sp. NPDC058176 TaxID=3346368 RepID=UPI0036DCA3C1
MTGLGTALRLGLRLNYRGLSAAVLAVIVCMYAGVREIGALYPSAMERGTYASIAVDLLSQKALQGPAVGLTSAGGIAVFEVGWYLTIAVALINIVVVLRNTRAQEAAGRLELLRAGRFGVHANSVAVFLLAFGADIVIGLGVAAAFTVAGAGGIGAVAFGAATTAVGTVFAALALVAAQLTEHAKGAYGIACGALGLAYLLRAMGDVTDTDFLRMVSPLGIVQAIHPFGRTQWWPLVLCAGVAVLAVAAAVALERARDYDAGLWRPATGSATASRFTRTIPGLVSRSARAGAAMWAVALLALGAGFGVATGDVGQVAAGTQGMLDLLAGFNVNVVDGFLAMSVLLLALAVVGGVIAQVLQLRAEELSGRADLILSGTVPKWRLAATHLGVGLALGVGLLLVVGAGIGAGHGIRSGDGAEMLRLLGAALAQLPAVVFFLGLTAAVIGLAPRLVWLPWVVLAVSAVVSILGPSMRVSRTTANLSVFEHLPRLPGVDVAVLPPLVLLCGGSLLAVVGIVGFARRDLS